MSLRNPAENTLSILGWSGEYKHREWKDRMRKVFDIVLCLEARGITDSVVVTLVSRLYVDLLLHFMTPCFA